MDSWLIVVIAGVVVVGALSLWTATRAHRDSPSAPEGEERELSPREKLARDGGMASFGLNPPWWIRPEEYRRRAASRRK